MALFNYTAKEITIKVVYYGPGLSGKTTNLQYLYYILDPDRRSKLVSLPTETDRTLFFDLLPVDFGKVRDFSIRFHLYTVPGQVRYNATRRLVLKGVDAVVFVADSQREMRNQNIESLNNMRENLIAHAIDPDKIPILFQYNKRDLSNILSVNELNKDLNEKGKYEYIEAIAIEGVGVEESFRNITKLVIAKTERKQKIRLSSPEKDIKTDKVKEVPIGADVIEPLEQEPIAIKPVIELSLPRAEALKDLEETPAGLSTNRTIVEEPLTEKPPIESAMLETEPLKEMEEEVSAGIGLSESIDEEHISQEPTFEPTMFKSETIKDIEEEEASVGFSIDMPGMSIVEEPIIEKPLIEPSILQAEPVEDVKEKTPVESDIRESVSIEKEPLPAKLVFESAIYEPPEIEQRSYIIHDIEEEPTQTAIEEEPFLREGDSIRKAGEISPVIEEKAEKMDVLIDNINEILSTLKEMNDLMKDTVVEQRKINIQLKDMTKNFEQIKKKKRWFRFL